MTANLQLPALFHGRYRDVKRRMSKVITQLRRGADWVAVIEDGGFLDVATTPGLIVTHGPSPLIGGEEHFNIFVFWRLVSERRGSLPERTRERVFERSLTTVWGTLGLISEGDTTLLVPRERHLPFLRAVVTCWDELTSAGRRYSFGVEGMHLWGVPSTLKYVLANQGVPLEPGLDVPPPPGGLLALIRQHGIDLTADPGGDESETP